MVGLGQGTLRLRFDAMGQVRGSIEGPLGPANVEGYAQGGRVTARIHREHPEDRGFVGTLVGDINASRIDGTLRVSPADAQSIRVASFSLTSEGAVAAGR